MKRSELPSREFAAAMGSKQLLANMTEFGKSPAMSAKELEALNYKMVIWPVFSLRIANRAQEILYRDLAEHGTTAGLIDNMQTRAQLYDLICWFPCGTEPPASAHRNILAFEPDSEHTDHDATHTRGTSFLEHSLWDNPTGEWSP